MESAVNIDISTAKPLDELDQLCRSALPLRYFQRVLGWHLTPLQQLQRLLYYLQRADGYEKQGKWVTADFFFTRAYAVLARGAARRPALEAWLRTQELATTPEDIVRHIAGQWGLQRHLGFIRHLEGNAGQAGQRRLADHLQHALQLARRYWPDDVDLQFDLQRRLVEAAEAREDFSGMARLAQQGKALGHDPFYFEQQWTKAIYREAIDSLKGIPPENTTSRLASGIEQLERQYHRSPDELPTQYMLADLYMRLCIAHSHAHQLSDALVAFEKSAAFNPHQPQLEDVRQKLHDGIYQLQKQVELLREELSWGGRQLTAEGHRMIRQADRGFQPSNNFIESDARAEIIANNEAAEFKDFWLQVNRGKHRDIDELPGRARSLNDALTVLLAHPDLEPANFHRYWAEARQPYAELDIVDPEDVYYFVRAIRFEAGTLDTSVPESGYKTDTFSRGDIAPLPGSPDPTSSELPFDYWLFSRRDALAKALVLTGLVLCLYAYGREWNERHKAAVRDEAFFSLVLSGESLPFTEVERQARRFLRNPSGDGVDSRQKLIEQVYANRFLTWSASPEAGEAEQVERHLKVLKNLIVH
jgi:hypothetical protein